MSTVILTGPQGCGKTRHAPALMQHLGCAKVVDEWWPGQRLVPGALHLTCEPVPQVPAGARLVVWPPAGFVLPRG